MTYTDLYTEVYFDIYGSLITPPPISSGNEVILAPPIIKLTVDYLNSRYDLGTGVKAHSQVPRQRPDTFVTVQRTGGPMLSIVADGAQVTYDAYAQTEPDAEALAELTRALLHAMSGTVQQGVAIYGVHDFGGPGFFPDPISEKPRYTATLQIVARAHAI